MKRLGKIILSLSTMLSVFTAPVVTADEKEVKEITIVEMANEAIPGSGQSSEQFVKDMEEALGVKVNQLEANDYTTGIEALKAGKLDVMGVTPMSMFSAMDHAGAEPLVTTTVFLENGTEYRSVFFVKADNDEINSLEDTEGKTIAFTDPASSSGYLYPKMLLVNELELDAEKLDNPGYFFSNVAFSGKHDSTVMGVVKGDYEVGATSMPIIKGMIDNGVIKEDDIKIIAETDVIPNPGYVIRGDLPEEFKEKVKEFYLNYQNEEFFETMYGDKETRFEEIDLADYQMAKDMREKLGIVE